MLRSLAVASLLGTQVLLSVADGDCKFGCANRCINMLVCTEDPKTVRFEP
jgi:hypothetical protein